jgi:RNA polymerase sigma-70 factor (ECF subfamily)
VLYTIVATTAIDSDLELMLRVRRGNAESFEVLLTRHRTPLLNYIRRMVRDQMLAEDLAQEVFLRVYQAGERYRPEARFTTWLYRIATNLALNSLRDRRGKQPVFEDDDAEPTQTRIPDLKPTAEQQLIYSEREDMIRRAVQALPENQRAAVLLHKYQEMDYRQIAVVLGVSESAVKSLLFRAYDALRARLTPLLRGGRS